MEKFTIGVGKIEITPPLSIPYLGYSPRHSFFKGVHDPLYARSIYISNGKEESVIISTDALGFSNSLLDKERNFTEEIRGKIEELIKVPEKNIMLTSSHIHSTPETLNIRPLRDHPGAIEWLEILQRQIVSSAKGAKENTFKAVLKIGKGKVQNISRNRRGEECIDEELIVLFFESEKGEKILLINFACHPVIVQVQELVSADFVGVAETKIEQIVENTKGCLFLQGACGDIDPRKGNTKDFQDVYFTGMALVGEVIKVFSQIHLLEYPLEPVILKTSSQKVSFPSRSLPAKREMKLIKTKAEKGDLLAQETLERVKEGKGSFAGEIQLIRIGNAVLVGLPGEPFCQMGLQIKKDFKPMIGVPVGYTNGYLGYVAPQEVWERGGYEVECGPWSKVGPTAFPRIIKIIDRLKSTL
jgi:hypothetical protein